MYDVFTYPADNLQRTIIKSVRRRRRTARWHSASGQGQSRPTLHPHGCVWSSTDAATTY